ncbi:hypothetical protein [Kitasatospora sp. GAS1066B]|uniref:hypothetical protein n=1 Tax=Kitasatospora sp. GAS1066B TaxID=3156271 RepID=UPI00351438F0
MTLPEATPEPGATTPPDCTVCAELDTQAEQARQVLLGKGRFYRDESALADVRIKRDRHRWQGTCTRVGEAR